jgi:hypothetical protein
VCLYTVCEVVKAGVEAHTAGEDTAWQVLYSVCYFVPLAMVFFGTCFCWGFYGMTFLNEGIEVDHLGMCMEGFEYSLACHPLRERSYSGEDGSFRHDKAVVVRTMVIVTIAAVSTLNL